LKFSERIRSRRGAVHRNLLDSPGGLKFSRAPSRRRHGAARAMASGDGDSGVQAGALTAAIDRDLPAIIRRFGLRRAAGFRALCARSGRTAMSLTAMRGSADRHAVLGVKTRRTGWLFAAARLDLGGIWSPGSMPRWRGGEGIKAIGAQVVVSGQARHDAELSATAPRDSAPPHTLSAPSRHVRPLRRSGVDGPTDIGAGIWPTRRFSPWSGGGRVIS